MGGQADLEASYSDFWDEIVFEAASSANSDNEAFFSLYARMAAENGECTDLNYAPVRREGRGGFQIDGYAFEPEAGELYLAICDLRSSRTVETLNAQQIETLTGRVRAFVEASLNPKLIGALEETSPAFEAGYLIFEGISSIRRIRIMIFSNARLSTRRPPEAIVEVVGKPTVFSVLDFTRYDSLKRSMGKPESIDIDIAALHGGPLPCLAAHAGEGEYSAYLTAIPGNLLAKIYGLYGARLLEQNVRTFLQAKTKVNRGIIKTIDDTPEMFFAYNNGITATASDLTTAKLADGRQGIATVSDLQIVNGGQTTASILYAKDKSNAVLDRVWVPMKLSVVSHDRIEELVPNISRFANTQNKISEADFFSSHGFHVLLEKISRNLMAPPRPSFLSGSRWFYERARGQYKDRLAYGTPAQRKRFEAEFPKEQVIDKTDLAKYEMTFDCEPHVVSLGAQKCFLEFSEMVGKKWQIDSSVYNDEWFKRATAKAMVFRETDLMIGESGWYKKDRGYKAQIVTYTIAWLCNHVEQTRNSEIALAQVWQRQCLPDELIEVLAQLAPQVARKIKDTPPNVKNVGEYCKLKTCWSAIAGAPFKYNGKPERFLVRIGAAVAEARQAERNLSALSGSWDRIVKLAKEKKLLSPKSEAALFKLRNQDNDLLKSERNALDHLLRRLQEDLPK